MGIQNHFLNQEETQRRRQAAVWSLIVSVVLMILKFWAHNLTDSQAIFSDAIESIVNVLASLAALWVIWYSAKPVDEDHPYGHGKVEFFSSAFEGGLIAFASVMIVFEAVRAFWRGELVQHLDQGLVIVGVAALVNWVLGNFLIRRGKQLGSMALRASGAHVISDFWTSVGVIGGLCLAFITGWNWLDSVMALAVGLWLGWTGLSLVTTSIGGLMDQEDPETLQALAHVFSENLQPGVIQIHHVRVIRSGWYHHIDAHIVMPEFWNVKQTHESVNKFEKAVIQKYEYGGDMNFHVDPCRRAYCQACNLANCPIRVESYVGRLPVQLEQIRSPLEPPEFVNKRNPPMSG